MSFDIKISQGGLEIGQDGDLVSIEKTDKLRQDCLKIINTQLGNNPFHKYYGSSLAVIVGNVLDVSFSATLGSSQLKTALSTLQKIQQVQNERQFLTPEEQLAAIKSSSVKQNSIDPRYIEISIKVANKAGEDLTVNSSITL